MIVSRQDEPTDWDANLSDLTRSVSEAAQILSSAGDTAETLASVIDLAVATIEGCDFAGIMVMDKGAITTMTHSDPIVATIDALQLRLDEGPSFDAFNLRSIIYANDLERAQEWVQFAPAATEEGVRSILSLPLITDTQSGTLNLYANYCDAFGVVDRAKAAVLVSLASLALSVAYSHENEKRLEADLRSALATRETIGAAMGILMERERITAVQAFVILRRASQHLNIKLREVAQHLVDTGESPDVGPRPAP